MRKSRSGVHRAAHFRNCRLSAGSIAEFRRGGEGARWLRCLWLLGSLCRSTGEENNR